MKTDSSHTPRDVPQVMVSSTFKDLEPHREALIKVIKANGLTDAAMENDSAKLADVIESSLQMVRESSAYIAILSKRYGQKPKCPKRNPNGLSVTELEFNEAVELGRPILLFVMGKDHLVHEDHIELDPDNRAKLKAFIERAKNHESSEVHRVYAQFDNLEQFKEKAGPSIAALRRFLDQQQEKPERDQRKDDDKTDSSPTIPAPPAFYAERDYIGRHTFIGRAAQLQLLSDWAKPSDPTSVLLFEAIGGNGKSMLTWQWAKDERGLYATTVRDWAGRFWYSFYEKGAIMRGFCQHALAYMTGQPLETFEKWPMADLRKDLLAQLHQRPWLLILDGLERVLVAYHRFDASEVRDEEVNRPTDKILNRDPCDAIRDEDTDLLLRTLAAAAPSKILISSRLIPRVLLNQAGIPLPGVKPLVLPGLDEPDAEALLRSCAPAASKGLPPTSATTSRTTARTTRSSSASSPASSIHRDRTGATSTAGPPTPTTEPS